MGLTGLTAPTALMGRMAPTGPTGLTGPTGPTALMGRMAPTVLTAPTAPTVPTALMGRTDHMDNGDWRGNRRG